MCEICRNVKTVDFFPNSKVYLECLNYIQSLVDSGDFLFESKDCDTDKAKNIDGCWIDDMICHVIKCRNCGQCFTCSVITDRGNGSFRKGK